MPLLNSAKAICIHKSEKKQFLNKEGEETSNGYFMQWIINEKDESNNYKILETWCDESIENCDLQEVYSIEEWDENYVSFIKYEVKVWGLKRKLHIKEIEV